MRLETDRVLSMGCCCKWSIFGCRRSLECAGSSSGDCISVRMMKTSPHVEPILAYLIACCLRKGEFFGEQAHFSRLVPLIGISDSPLKSLPTVFLSHSS